MFHSKFLKQVLSVKSSTCDQVVYGELGQLPISLNILLSCFLAFFRFKRLPKSELVKYVFDEMMRLNGIGFHSWVTKVIEEADHLGINFDNEMSSTSFKSHVMNILATNFRDQWSSDVIPSIQIVIFTQTLF